MKLLVNYVRLVKRSTKRFDNRGRPWREYMVDVLVIVGIPLSLFFILVTVLVAAGVGSVEVDGKMLSGTDVLLPGFAAALVALPLGCAFVGTIAYLMREKMRIR